MRFPGRAAGGTRLPVSRRWLYAGGVILGLAVLTALALVVVYPRVGARMIRSKVTAKLGAKLGREIRIGPIDVSIGHATIRDLEIRGPHDGDTPLVHVARIDVEFDGLRSLVGAVELGAAKVEGVTIAVRRDDAGQDNVRDLVDRLRAPDPDASGGGGGGASLRPTSIRVERIKLLADDARTGATALVANGSATWKPGELLARLEQVSATTVGAPKAEAALVEIRKRSGEPPTISVDGGALAVWPQLALSGISGSVMAHPQRPGEYTLELSGGYGGVPGKLWTAKGAIDPRAQTASIDLVAAKFQLDRLAPLLAQTPVVDYAETSVDTTLHLELHAGGATFAGGLTLHGLSVGHPMIAATDVHGLDLSAQVEGSFDRASGRLELTRGDFVARDLPFAITGTAVRGRPAADEAPPEIDPRSGLPVPRHGPGGLTQLALRLVIPPIACQRVLDAIPTEMAPYLAGYKLRGTFDTDVHVEIDWADLDATKLGGSVGLRACKVIDEPDEGPKRLEEEFEHWVEVEQDVWISFLVGDTNTDFVPLDQISPYLIKSITTTEDGAFYRHRGFITSEFRTALVSNLKAGRFRHGASSITMQFVKNVLLYREKTLARKLQELFLTWHVENTLTKDRILEIYFNVIEYGPGIYGIGQATWHYFSKPPKDLNPVEAAFFSSILPSPKARYKQYCAGTLNKWTTSKIQRILALMLKREKITQEEYDQAIATPLLFAKDNSETEKECLDRVKKAIKNARPTNPMKK